MSSPSNILGKRWFPQEDRTVIDTFYQNPRLTLVVIFLYGVAVGLFLAALMTYLYWYLERRINKQSSANQEKAALNALEEVVIEVDEDRMLCAICWEERHPGSIWSLGRRALCAKHLMSEQEAGEQILTFQH